MADLREYAKGITFFVFVTLLFYFLWANIFSNIIGFVGSDLFSIGSEGSNSIAILKGMAWVSFVFLYLSVGSIYLIFSIIAGSRGTIKTNPIQFLYAIGIWSILMPFLTFIYGLIHTMVNSLNETNIISSSMETTAGQFSWIFGIIILGILVIVPFIFVLKGYGIDLVGKNQEIAEKM